MFVLDACMLYCGHMTSAHVHHRLLYSGFTEREVCWSSQHAETLVAARDSGNMQIRRCPCLDVAFNTSHVSREEGLLPPESGADTTASLKKAACQGL